ncbi:hypothetical protein V8E53_003105 [Lactarius tabidus]
MAAFCDSPPFVSGAYEVASHHVGTSLVDAIRNLFPSGKKRRGDYYLDRSNPLIERYYDRYDPEDQDAIQSEWQRTLLLKEELDSAGDSISLSLAKNYKTVAKHLFKIVDRASRRVASNSLRAQFSEALGRRAAQPPPSPPETTGNPCISPWNPHEVPSLADGSVGNLDQVGMTILQSETTGEAAVFLHLHGRDGRTQDLATTVSPTAGIDGRTNEGVETATVSSYSHGFFGPQASDDAGQ